MSIPTTNNRPMPSYLITRRRVRVLTMMCQRFFVRKFLLQCANSNQAFPIHLENLNLSEQRTERNYISNAETSNPTCHSSTIVCNNPEKDTTPSPSKKRGRTCEQDVNNYRSPSLTHATRKDREMCMWWHRADVCAFKTRNHAEETPRHHNKPDSTTNNTTTKTI